MGRSDVMVDTGIVGRHMPGLLKLWLKNFLKDFESVR